MSVTVADIGDEIKVSYQPSANEDLPYIGLEHVEPNSLHLSSYGSSTEVESTKYRYLKGDILFGTLRPYFKKLVVAPFDGVCSTEFCVIRPKNERERHFLFYLLAQDRFIEYATKNSVGARPRTKWSLFSDFGIRDFSPSEKYEIGRCLLNYDDLIENNRRRIQLLEESARLLYKEWFVQLRFPGHEHVKIIDGVPEGWGMRRIDSFGEVITGKTPSTKREEFYGGDIPFIKTPDMHGQLYVLQTEQSLTEAGAKTQANKFLPKDSIMISCIGTLGVVSLTSQDSQTNQQINSLIPTDAGYRSFLLFSFKGLKAKLEGFGGGATMANVNKGNFASIELFTATENLILEFENCVAAILDQIKTLQQQNQKLAQARDILLPRLMNGELAT